MGLGFLRGLGGGGLLLWLDAEFLAKAVLIAASEVFAAFELALVAVFPFLALALGIEGFFFFVVIVVLDFVEVALVFGEDIHMDVEVPGVAARGDKLAQGVGDGGEVVEIALAADVDKKMATAVGATDALPHCTPAFAEDAGEAAVELTDEPVALGDEHIVVIAVVARDATKVGVSVVVLFALAFHDEAQRGQWARWIAAEFFLPRGTEGVEGGEIGRDDGIGFYDDLMEAWQLGEGGEIRREFVAQGDATELAQGDERREVGVLQSAEVEVSEFDVGGQGAEVGEEAVDFQIEQVGETLDAVEQVGVFQREAAEFRHGGQIGDAAEGNLKSAAVVDLSGTHGGQGGDGSDGQHVSVKLELVEATEVFQPAEAGPWGMDTQGEFFEVGESSDGAEIASDFIGDVEAGDLWAQREGRPIGDFTLVKVEGGEVPTEAQEGKVAQVTVVADVGGEVGDHVEHLGGMFELVAGEFGLVTRIELAVFPHQADLLIVEGDLNVVLVVPVVHAVLDEQFDAKEFLHRA